MFKFNRDCCDAVAGNTRAGRAYTVTKQSDIDACGGDEMLGLLMRAQCMWIENHPDDVVQFDGHAWISRLREEWVTDEKIWGEGETITLNSFRRMVTRGHKLGVLVTAQRATRYSKFKRAQLSRPSDEYWHLRHQCAAAAPHMRSDCAADALLMRYPDQEHKQEHKHEQNRTLLANARRDLRVEKTDSSSGETEKACISAGSGYPEEAGGKFIPFPVKAQGGAGMPTVAETVASQVAKHAKKPIDTLKPDKVDSLVHVWNNGFKGKVAPAVTNKVCAQLKRLIKIWPPGEAPAILEFIMSNWFDFCYAAEKGTNAQNMPDMPQIDRLVKHQQVGVTLYRKSKLKAKASKPVAKPEPVQLIAQKPAEPVEDDKPMTMAELQAMEEAELKAAS